MREQPKLYNVDLTHTCENERRVFHGATAHDGSRRPHRWEIHRESRGIIRIYAEVKDSPSPYPTSSYERAAASYRSRIIVPFGMPALKLCSLSVSVVGVAIRMPKEKEKPVPSPSGIRRRRRHRCCRWTFALPRWLVGWRGRLVNKIVGCTLRCVRGKASSRHRARLTSATTNANPVNSIR